MNKKILITGATKGLGKEAAIFFASKGYSLILAGRCEKKLSRLIAGLKNKKKHISLLLDLQDIKQIENLKIDKRFLNLHCILHCAGGGLGIKNVNPKSHEFTKVLNVNALSLIQINNKLFQILKKNRGTIVHVGSIASYEAVGSLAYNCAKALLAAYVRTAGREMIKKRIIITGILPGGFIGHNNAMSRLKKNNKKAYNEFINKRLPAQKMFKTSDLMPMIEMMCLKKLYMLAGNLVSMDAGEGKTYSLI